MTCLTSPGDVEPSLVYLPLPTAARSGVLWLIGSVLVCPTEQTGNRLWMSVALGRTLIEEDKESNGQQHRDVGHIRRAVLEQPVMTGEQYLDCPENSVS